MLKEQFSSLTVKCDGMLCLFLDRACSLPGRGPAELHKPCFACALRVSSLALLLIFGPPYHTYVSWFISICLVELNSQELNQWDTFFLNNFPLALRLRIRIAIASRGVVH